MKKIEWSGFLRDLRFYFSRKLDFPFIAPYNLTLNLAYRCNQRCIMCLIKKDNISPEVELSLEEIKDIIDQAADWGIPEIVLTGGEPLILKEIFAIIDYAAGKNVRPTLITNCFCGRDIVERLKTAPLAHMQVSVDGADAATHDYIRQSPGSFAVTIANLKELIAAGGRKYTINATTTIMNQNVGQLLEIAELMKDIGVHKLSIRPAHHDNSNPMQTDKINNAYWIPPERLNVLSEQLGKLCDYHNQTDFIDCRPGFKYIEEYYKNGYIRPTDSCYNGYNRLVIAYNERDSYEVWMCAGMLGDIRKSSLYKIWRSPKAKEARKKMRFCKKSCVLPCCYESGLENLVSIIRKNLK